MVKTLYIGGSGRSGTTVLRKLLSKHSEILDIPEFRYAVDPGGIWEFYRDINNMTIFEYQIRVKNLKKILSSCRNKNVLDKFLNKLDNFSDKFKLTRAYCSINVEAYIPRFQEISKKLINSLEKDEFKGSWEGMNFGSKKLMYMPQSKKSVKNSIKNFVQDIEREALSFNKKSIYLEKNTWSILCFDQILDIFPDSKLIHIYRDPRDVVASFLTQRWVPNDPKKAAEAYLIIMKSWLNIREKIKANNLLEISLEELINDQKNVVRKICRFSNLREEESLFKFPLNKGNIGRWKKDLRLNEQKCIQSTLSKILEIYNYE